MATTPTLERSKTRKLPPPRPCRATQTFPRYGKLLPGEPCFLDIEYQKYRPKGAPKEIHRLGRTAVLNSGGEAVLDVYCFYPNVVGVSKCRLRGEYGVEWEDLLIQNGAVSAKVVERWLAKIVKNRPVVVHGGKHDLTAFFFEKDVFATSKIVDTQDVFADQQHDGTPGLRTLAANILGINIQEEMHSPVEDADAMRQLYLIRRPYNRAAALAHYTAMQAAKQSLPNKPQTSTGTTLVTTSADTSGNKPINKSNSKQNSKPAQKSGNLPGSAKAKARKLKAAQAAIEE